MPVATFAVLAAVIPAVLLVGQLALTDAPPVATSPLLEASQTAAIDSPPAATPTESASRSPEPTWEPAPSVAPAANDVLGIAGRDGVPGLLDCGAGFRFSFDAMNAPTGAEARVGPEYDALRGFVGVNVANGDTQLSLDFRAREVTRTSSVVAFLLDRHDPGPWGENGGPYLYVSFRMADGQWKWAGSGDCQPRAHLPLGYLPATWQLDPAFSRPAPTTQTLHLLVSEFECAGGRSATGRIGPAYVITDRYEVHIAVAVLGLTGDQDCPAAPPTPARLRLPEPIGDRMLRDTNAHIRSGTGG